ncbi:MAG: hypothetical protein HON19_05155 [Flavobacteriales bacterium]|nr:hypothetical protein [Flavobacteriales bacterium]
MNNNVKAYNLAQRAISDLKTAVHLVLSNSDEPLTNAGIGRKLGIYHGHSGQHEGHISRVVLGLMESEGVVLQDKNTKKWQIKNNE